MRHETDIPSASVAAVKERLSKTSGREYWRSLEELAETPELTELLHREFPRQASELGEGFDRRRFLELMGASLSLAGLSACVRQPREGIVPYVKQPEEVLPGTPLYFATAVPLAGYAAGLLVTSHTGRPTKVEGNPDHPSSLGAADLFAQASTLSLYDPDRSQTISKAGEIRTWGAFLDELKQRIEPLKALQGEGLRILTGTVTSPTLAGQLRDLIAAMPKVRWHQYEPAGRDNVRAGALLAFGERVETRYDFGKADVVLTFDADPFSYGPGHLRYAREFATRRRVEEHGEGMPCRYYAVESTPSNSATLADHRLSLPPAGVHRAALALAAELGVPGVSKPAGDASAAWLAAAAADLRKAGARAVVVPGEFAPAEVHALCHAINQALGADGSTVIHSDPVEAEPTDQLRSLQELTADMNAGKVDVLLILGGNPVFDAPVDLGFKDAMLKTGFRVHLGLHDDETSAYCQWHVPDLHPLESWSDARGHDGTVTILQPLIEPLYDGHSAHELLAALAGQTSTKPLDIVKAHWQKQRPGADFEAFWRKSLHDGLMGGTALPARALSARPQGIVEAAGVLAKEAPAHGLELILRPDPAIFDGRFANNGWLQELPRPLSKVTWDNAAYMSKRTADSLGLASPVLQEDGNADVVELTVDGRKLEAPAWILPGHADGCVTLHFGQGRTRAGNVGNGVGVNAYAIRTSAAPWQTAASVAKTGRKYLIATTQHHFNMEGRNLIRTATVAEYRKDPEVVRKMGEAPSADDTLHGHDHRYDNYAWGLAVNLSSCTGCNACVVACQSENNVPIVGKDQVARGREMQWIRIDRYYEGPPEDPAIHNQPVLCMHCEKAPCEVVCPVAATTHSEEGLNEMTYNRCVGTKYCSNNCPYKVRRFNFYEYNGDKALPVMHLLANPNVTVRSRGVMEKCTYCVQRINAGRIAAERDGRKVLDGEIVPACAQTCPTEALVFGDVNDPASRVARLKKEPLNYGLLEELNTRPRTTYLAKLVNPNPDIRGGKA